MSRQSFEDFMQKVQADDSLREALRAELGDPAQGIPLAELARFAGEHGYQFDVEEVTAGAGEAELSEDELGSVVGGSMTYNKIGMLSFKFYTGASSTSIKYESPILVKW